MQSGFFYMIHEDQKQTLKIKTKKEKRNYELHNISTTIEMLEIKDNIFLWIELNEKRGKIGYKIEDLLCGERENKKVIVCHNLRNLDGVSQLFFVWVWLVLL